MISVNARTSALVLIDLQSGILSLPTRPRPAAEVLTTGRILAERFRARGAPVVLVNVDFGPERAYAPPGTTQQASVRAGGSLPPEWSRLADGLAAPGDILITKRQWGAFTGTGLDQTLRRLGVDTIVLGGIATNFGVESTARHAWELNYHVVVVEDACTTTAPDDAHALAFDHVFPRIARITQSDGLEIA
ncbi:MAG: isochorismatase family protein [Telmatospirillum sp.]|nr:isochorismatase family protein [Telmatospirillum sp.]